MTISLRGPLTPLLLMTWLAQPAAAAPRDTTRQWLEDSSEAALMMMEDGPTRIVRGFEIDPGTRSPEGAALHALDEVGPVLGLPSGSVTWTHRHTTRWRGRTLVRLHQVHEGIPVLGASAVVKLDRAGRVTLVNHGHPFDGATLVTTNYVYEDGSGYDNAFYTTDISGNQILCFGQGTFDFAYDAGVIAHEFGHSVIQTTTNMLMDWIIYDEYGANNAPNGIHEGLADYWAGTYQGRSEVSSWVPVGRDMDNDHVCPDDLTGESHDDGMIVGAAAWDIYLQVGKEAADDIVYGALLLVSQAPTFAELAEAMIEAASDLEEDGEITGEDLEAIQASLDDRGMLVCGRSLPIDPDEPFEYELGLFMGMQELDEEWCDRMREMGVNFMPAFQFSLTTPPAADGVLEELEISIDMDRYDGGSFGEAELLYTFMIREGEMVTVDFETIETPGGYEMETPIPGESDRQLDDNPDEIVITLEDEDIELLSDTTYYMTLLHRNCAAADMTLEVEFTIAAPPADDDDEDDEGDGCSCRLSGGPPAVPVAAGLGLALLGLALRRRR